MVAQSEIGDESKNGGGICSSVRYNTYLYCLVVQASFYGDKGRVLNFCAEGRGFDPQPGQKVISVFSPVTYIICVCIFDIPLSQPQPHH